MPSHRALSSLLRNVCKWDGFGDASGSTMPSHRALSSLLRNAYKLGGFGVLQAVSCPLLGHCRHSSEMLISGVDLGCFRQYHALS